MCDSNVITCPRKQADVNLTNDSDSGKHAFRDFKFVVILTFLIIVTVTAVYVLQTCYMALWVNMLMKKLTCSKIYQTLTMWQVLFILITLRIVTLMIPNLMTPIFGHFMGRLKTVECTLPIHIGQILVVLVLVLCIYRESGKGVGFMESRHVFWKFFSQKMQQSSCRLSTNNQCAKREYYLS